MPDYFPKWKLTVIALVAITHTYVNGLATADSVPFFEAVGYLFGSFVGLSLFAAPLTAMWRATKRGVSRARGQESQ